MTQSSPLYLYAVCQIPPTSLSLPPGIFGRTELVTVEDLGVVVESEVDLPTIQNNDQQLLTAVLSHDRVICDLFQQTVLLPLRFGTQMGSWENVRSHLVDHRTPYRHQLTTLAGMAEYQLKLVPLSLPVAEIPEGLKGREYFLAKKQRLQDQQQAQETQRAEVDQLAAVLQTTFAQHIRTQLEEGNPRFYLLLGADQTTHLGQQVEDWQNHCPHWDLTLSQALPPYHFV